MPHYTGSNYGQIENHFLDLKYTNMVTLMAQQKQSKLEKCVTVMGGLSGVNAVAANQLGKFTTVKRNDRYEDTPIADITRERRWVSPEMFHGAFLIDDLDKIHMDITPEDKVVQAIYGEYGTKIDSTIIAAYFGANKTGRDATGTTAYNTSNTVAETTDPIADLIDARNILIEGDIDIENEEIFCLVPPQLEKKLLASGYFVSSDFNNDKPLTGKNIPGIAGINFVRTNLLPATGNNIICPVFCKSGVALGKWKEISVKVADRPDVSMAKQIYASYALGATRLEEDKCAAITVTK